MAQDELYLDDARDGLASIPLSDAVLEPRSDAFESLFAQIFDSRSAQVHDALAAARATRRAGPAKLKEIRLILEYFSQIQIEFGPDHLFKIGHLIERADMPRLEEAPKPVYVFDPTGGKTDTWADGGLQKYGPYSQQTFPKNCPRIAVICQSSVKGRVEQFLQKLLNGQKHPTKNRGPFDNGLIGKYRLEGVSTTFFLAKNPSVAAYRQAAEEPLSCADRWDLALVQIEGKFRDLEGGDNPYLATKHIFLAHQTPSQEFTLETIGLGESSLVYALNNIALATYSKLGGTPWLLRSDRAIAHELVIGIGTAIAGNGRLGDRRRSVGFTTVFSGDGDYRISNRSRAVPFSDYGAALLDTLKETVRTVSSDMNWQGGDHVRLVFHAFKPFRNAEAGAVKELVATLGDYDVDYCFVEVSESHPYLLFDEGQRGIRDYQTKQFKGAFVPHRGQVLRLSGREALLILTGPKDIKRPEDGMPSPVLLRLHRQSTFTDLTYVCRQLFVFSNHSWRSFFPGSLPVTVQYSELIAGLLGELARLPNWNPDVLWGRVGQSRWFL